MTTSARRISSALSLGLVAAMLAGCGGGGGTAATPPLTTLTHDRAAAGVQSSTTFAAAKGNVTFTIGITPKAKAGRIAPQYVSPSTESLQILVDGVNPVIVNLTPSSPNCSPNPAAPGSYICTASLTVPTGNHVFTVTAYDATGGKGNALSTNSTGTVFVKPTGTTTIAIVLQGVVKYAVLTLTTTSPPSGVGAKIGLTVVLEDADKNLIVGPAPFENPVKLTTTDSADGPISKTSLHSPADETGLTIAYTGAAVASITYSATAAGLPAANVTPAVLTPQVGPSGSNALGIYTAPNKATYAFVPNGTGLAVVEISNGATLTASSRVNGAVTAAFTPIQIRLTPLPSACTPDSTDKLLYCFSFFDPRVNVLDLSTLPSAPTVKATYETDAATGVDNSSGGCQICGAVYDSADKAIVYATGNGYELYSSALSTSPSPNTHLLTVPVNVSENFGYDPKSDTIFSPEYDGFLAFAQSIDVLPLAASSPVKDSVFHLSPQPSTLAEPDAGAVDESTGIGVSTEEISAASGDSNTAYLVNISAPKFNSPSSGLFAAPETTTSLSSSLFGFTTAKQCAVPVTNIAVDSEAHVAFFSAEFCGQSPSDRYQADNGAVTPVGVAALPPTSSSPLKFGSSIFANLPALPDGSLWDDALDPHAIAAFNIPGCAHCGAIFNLEDSWIAVINLTKLAAAPAVAGDPHTVNPKYDLIANGVVTYIPTGFTSTTAAALARPHLPQRRPVRH